MKKGIRKRILDISFLRVSRSEDAGWAPTPTAKARLGMNTKTLTVPHSSKRRLQSPFRGRGFNGLINLKSPMGLLAVSRETQINRCKDIAQITCDVRSN